MNIGHTRGPRRIRTPHAALVAALGAALTVTVALAACTTVPSRDVAAADGPVDGPVVAAVASEASTESIAVDGLDRTYLLHAPQRAVADAPLPLLLVIHGAGGNATRAEAATRMTALADADGFIVAYPQGTQAADVAGEYSWNAGACCAKPVTQNIDDVAFIDAMIDDIATDYPVDPQRIYIAGFSNGGMLAYRLACELDRPVAGIAVVSGALNVAACEAPAATSVLMIHGTGDKTVPYAGGNTNERTAGRFGQWHNASLDDAVTYWSGRDGCTGAPVTSVNRLVSRASYGTCDDDVTIDVVTIDGGGHVWPSKAKGDVDASDLITEYFRLSAPEATLAQ
ncbi:MAG: alpha/beta hydrolase family esterase [Microbacteriaceae bacterium]